MMLENSASKQKAMKNLRAGVVFRYAFTSSRTYSSHDI
jgi:hypothetical protein